MCLFGVLIKLHFYLSKKQTIDEEEDEKERTKIGCIFLF
jgi:hypothetical protein